MRNHILEFSVSDPIKICLNNNHDLCLPRPDKNRDQEIGEQEMISCMHTDVTATRALTTETGASSHTLWPLNIFTLTRSLESFEWLDIRLRSGYNMKNGLIISIQSDAISPDEKH